MNPRSILLILAVFSLSITLPLTPYIINQAPFIGDSWVHVRYADSIVESGKYSLDEYNRMWPLINMLIAFLRLITGMPLITVSQFIPGLAGLSTLIIYLFLCRLRIGFISRLIGTLAFSFTPLYTPIIFYSAVMKETAALYPLLTLLYVSTFFSKPDKTHYILNLLASTAVILGHHFGGLVALFYLLSASLQRIYKNLSMDEWSGSILPALAFLYMLLYSAWNLLAINIIGLFFKFTAYDAVYILSFFTLISVSTLKMGNTPISVLAPILTLMALAGFRGVMYESITMQPPITVHEVAYYLVMGVLAAIGLKLSDHTVISLSSAIASIYLACAIWDVGYMAIVLFTKSLHYLSIPIAMGLALFCERIKHYQRCISIILALTLISTPFPGISLAIKGLSSYSSADILSLNILKEKISDQIIYTDTRLDYLARYLYNIKISLIPLTGRLKGMLLLSHVNENQGLLYGYERIQMGEVISDMDLREAEKYYDSLNIFLICLKW